MLMLARQHAEREVTVGVTRSGRSAQRAGVEQAVGLYISTLPLRVQTPLGALLVPWLEALQREQA